MIIVIIIASSIIVVLDNPLNDPRSPFSHILDYFNTTFTFIFTCEAIIKIIAFGFVVTSIENQKSYLCHIGNVLDFLVVISSLADFFISKDNH